MNSGKNILKRTKMIRQENNESSREKPSSKAEEGTEKNSVSRFAPPVNREDYETDVNEADVFPSESRLTEEEIREANHVIEDIISNIESVIVGKRHVVELVTLALICGGHVLIEDVPGVGKTSLVSALAGSVSCGFKRIQFTPDVMPSDISGFSIYNQKSGEFEFRPGAVMSNLILADEINRASAKTQASLLEAMEERQVTVDSVTYPLKEPFMVLATQNPLDSFGTYPLPEAQVDRFMMKISIGYPSPQEEMKIAYHAREAKKQLNSVASPEIVLALRSMAEQVLISRPVAQYIVSLVTSSRQHAELLLGSSPRGTLALFDSTRALALMRGRSYVIPDDVKYLAPYVLAHRLTLNHEAKIKKRTAPDIVQSILESIAVPKGQMESENSVKRNHKKGMRV